MAMGLYEYVKYQDKKPDLDDIIRSGYYRLADTGNRNNSSDPVWSNGSRI
jgi:hypothetical protein